MFICHLALSASYNNYIFQIDIFCLLFNDVSEIHTYTTRSAISQNFHIQTSRTNLSKKSFSHFGAKVWNEIPLSIKKLSKKIFKKTMHTKLLELLCQEDTYVSSSAILIDIRKSTSQSKC